MGPELKPKFVKVDEARKEVVYIIDQFEWFGEGLDYGEVPPNVSRKSTVHFVFPHSEGLSSAHLFVIGSGNYTCRAYFSSFNKEGKSCIWDIFNYDCEKSRKKHKFTPVRESVHEIDNRTFTTVVTPFLHSGEYPHDFARVYRFPIFGSETLEVRAQRTEPQTGDWLSVSFLPDAREGEPYGLVKIMRTAENRSYRWYSPQLEV